jgi:hypothetical protein
MTRDVVAHATHTDDQLANMVRSMPQIINKIKLLYYIPTSSEIVVYAVRSSPL